MEKNKLFRWLHEVFFWYQRTIMACAMVRSPLGALLNSWVHFSLLFFLMLMRIYWVLFMCSVSESLCVFIMWWIDSSVCLLWLWPDFLLHWCPAAGDLMDPVGPMEGWWPSDEGSGRDTRSSYCLLIWFAFFSSLWLALSPLTLWL